MHKLYSFFLNAVLLLSGILGLSLSIHAQKMVSLDNGRLRVEWQKKGAGYRIARIALTEGGKTIKLPRPSGEYTVLYSAGKPDSLPLFDQVGEQARNFPEPIYKYIINTWHDNLKPVPMNTAGKALQFFPAEAKAAGQKAVTFSHGTTEARLTATWKLDPAYPEDILVTLQLRANKAGYFSLATPTLATLTEQDLQWGTIPGHLQGNDLQDDLVLAYAYGQGIPKKPVVVRDRTASTLSPLLSHRNGLTLAVIPAPGTGRHPWEKDRNTHSDWHLGLSLMNRRAELTPTAYHPVLGQKGSYLNAGDTKTFSFRYTLQNRDWYAVYKHAVYDVYRFRDFLSLKETQKSLTDRIQTMHGYVTNDSTSLWRIEQFMGHSIGAQAYLGGVFGSDRDAMKNSDYGAMWMLTKISGDTNLARTRLPFARNFKLVQQQGEPGFFQGAAVGQYYLSKSSKFTEEWGPYVEPIGLTYYTMLDIGNVLLFEPGDEQLRERLRLGAERLLSWQYPDGRWEVAYDRQTEQPLFRDISDLRPTFYGLLVAYKLLGDKRYLDAARKGAEWFIENAANRGHFLGVCGDLRFVPDFATGQSVQALLDLYNITANNQYKEAALRIARIYTTSIYTHPIPSKEKKIVKGSSLEDWQISQVGLSFEHGGTVGSANMSGPILLASHAGMFVRLFGITKDSLFLDMARAAALGRDAFVHEPTGVASYYWRTMNAGAGPYPHHAWWQIGWITDYLLSEASLRSNGQINFPRGFITPKVGPHQTYGFAPGKVFGQEAELFLPVGIAKVADPQVDYFGAKATDAKRLYLLLLNNDDNFKNTRVRVNLEKLTSNSRAQIRKAELLDETGKKKSDLPVTGDWHVALPVFGLAVVAVQYE